MEEILKQILVKLDSLEKGQNGMRSEMNEFKAEQSAMRSEMNEFKTEQFAMRSEMNEFKAVQSTMRSEMNEFQAELTRMNDQIGEVKADQTSMSNKQDSMSLLLDDLRYEQSEMRKEVAFYYGSIMKKLDETKVELSSEINQLSTIQKQHQDVLELLNEKQ